MERSRQEGASARREALPWQWRLARGVLYQAALMLAAVTLWVLLFAVFAAISGCSQRTAAVQPTSCRAMNSCGHGHWLGTEPRASLVFSADPELTPMPADQVARADWPTTAGATSYGQTVDYQEYRYDAQGLGPYDFDSGYRTFTSTRSGQQSSN